MRNEELLTAEGDRFWADRHFRTLGGLFVRASASVLGR
jgi:hypothetical protein